MRDEPREVTTAFGTVIVDRPEKAERDESGRDGRLFTSARVLVGVCVFIVASVCVAQLISLPDLLDPNRVLTAGFAKPLVAALGVGVVGLIGAAALLPQRLLYLPVAAAAGFAGLALLATLTVGGEGWNFAAGLLTLSACWIAGRWVLGVLKTPDLAAMPPVAWLAGTATIGLPLLLVGRAGLLRWWTVGVVVLALGGVALLQLARTAKPLIGSTWSALTESRLAAACAALVMLPAGLAAVWTAAPELMFDALYSKAWLPAEWARTGDISSLRDHVILNLYGFAQLLAIPGHLLGADGVGRYMQWLAVGAIPASLWWFLRSRTPWAPLAAAAVAVTPMLFWEATTAYDDALLALAAIAFAQAVVVLLESPRAQSVWDGAAVGLLAGACVDLKLHLVWLVLGLVLVYLVLRPRIAAAVGVLAGGVATAGPPLVTRWADIGDPLYPALLSVFHSPYLAPGGPIATRAGEGGGQVFDTPIQAAWHTVIGTDTLFSPWPTGAFGVLTLALLGAVVAGVMLRKRPGGRVLLALSGALAAAALGWYLQLKGPRYLLPTGILAVMVLGLAARGQRLTHRAELSALAGLAVVAILLWPSTVAQFWNVPGKDMPLAAALGLKDATGYERESQPERAALAAFDADSPPDAIAVSDATQRTWLSGARDLKMVWELQDRLLLDGHLPATPPEALRRIRATGADWVLTKSSAPRQPGFYYLYGAIQRYGELRWADGYWSLFHLSDHPTPPEALPACDDDLRGDPGCWVGGLDRHPGYSSQEAASKVIRSVDVCPGDLLSLDVSTEGRGLLKVAIDFNGPDPTRGHVRPVVAANLTARVGGTAPPGATRGVVTLLRPPEGLRVSRAQLRHLGGCRGHTG